MEMNKNIGKIDRTIRIVIFLIAIYLGYAIAPWFYLFAAWELFTILTRWCFAYDLLNINTNKNGK